MKKLFLLMIISTTLFSSELFNLKKPLFGENSYEAYAIMRINSITEDKPMAVPIKLQSISSGLQEFNENQYILDLMSKMSILLPTGGEETIETKTVIVLDEFFRTVGLIEETYQGEKMARKICKSTIYHKEEPLKNKIGYRSKDEELVCDDGGLRISHIELRKGENDTANLYIESDATSNMRILSEKTLMNISKSGKINNIKSEIVSENLFVINYETNNIRQ